MVRGSLFASGWLNIIVGLLVIFASFGERTSAGFQGLFSIGMGMALAGLLLLGFARVILLLEQIVSNTSAPAPVFSDSEPVVGNHTLAGAVRDDIYAGRRYSVHGDGKVLSRLRDGQGTWRTEAEFKAWADNQPPLQPGFRSPS